jgi:hypothetical protein
MFRSKFYFSVVSSVLILSGVSFADPQTARPQAAGVDSTGAGNAKTRASQFAKLAEEAKQRGDTAKQKEYEALAFEELQQASADEKAGGCGGSKKGSGGGGGSPIPMMAGGGGQQGGQQGGSQDSDDSSKTDKNGGTGDATPATTAASNSSPTPTLKVPNDPPQNGTLSPNVMATIGGDNIKAGGSNNPAATASRQVDQNLTSGVASITAGQ